MQWSKILTLYGVHAEGEVGRVITGGVIDIPGKTMLDKMRYINEENDWLKRFTLYEPRGSAQMSANVLVPPVNEEAVAGFIVLQPDQAHALSGSNTMCVTTVLLETGMVPMKEPFTEFKLDTPAGLIPVKAECKGGKVLNVTIDVCPSFAECLDTEITVEDIGNITVDIGFGGCYFCMVDVKQLGFEISPQNARKMVEVAKKLKKAADEQIKVQHPEEPLFNHIEYMMYTDVNGDEAHVYKNGTIIYPGRVDRSPCGTGSSSRMAVMHAKKELKCGETVWMESTIGGRFKAEIVEELELCDGRKAIIPRLSGRCWIYAIEHFGVDPSDPFQTGYVMADTWGPDVETI
ncbi:MAG: proline racemase family protein [Clostridia bacterium]|nr:proline racemase family protein [Clostridia bacterium]